MSPPGECAALVASVDWARTALGAPDGWSPALRAMVATILASRQPMLLFWGRDLNQIYNDAFVPSFGRGKHPAAMGQPAAECWQDAWPVVGAQIAVVMAGGEAAWFSDALVPIHRNGRMEEVFWNYSYSPAFEADGRIAGTLVICTEMTGRVVAARRLAALSTLSAALADATTRDEVLRHLHAVAAANAADLPLVREVDAAPGEQPVMEPAVLEPWPEPVERMFVVELAGDRRIGFGLSPRLPFDDSYRSYLLQIGEQVSAALRRIATATAQVEASRAKDEFLAMLGHELRNPLAPIAAAVELMKRKDSTSAREQATIERQLQHVTRLVDDLLDVSRITRGMIELRPRPIELTTVVARAIEMARPLIQQHEHGLTVEVPAGLVVDADEGRLVQVVSNLVTNAARYTPPGGTIRVEVAERGDAAVLRVIDNGVGMEPELVDRAFDLFVQGKRNPDRAEGGLGLGLALVKRLVELHGGTVTVTSGGRGAGTEVTVTLPLSTLPAVEVAPRIALPVAGDAKRVVIVDDNEDAALLLSELLRTFGHDVATAHDPHIALRLIGDFRPDVAVLDIGLPGVDGYELAGMIRRGAHTCRLIALTGYGQDSDRERALAAGFDAHLVKPVSLPALLQVLA